MCTCLNGVLRRAKPDNEYTRALATCAHLTTVVLMKRNSSNLIYVRSTDVQRRHASGENAIDGCNQSLSYSRSKR